MQSHQGAHSDDASDWTLCVGPGDELADLAPLLESLASTRNDPRGFAVQDVSDVADLMAGVSTGGRLILAGDGFPEEDIGFVRRFLAKNPGWELVLLGRDPGARVARVLLGLGRASWLQQPPDLDQLRHLARRPPGHPEGPAERTEPDPGPDPGPTPPDPAPPPPEAREAPPETFAEPPTPSAALEPPPPPSGLADPHAGRPTPPSVEPLTAPASADPTLGEYVGPLADLVQRVDLSLEMAADAEDRELATPRDDLGHLRQMTHMMKRVAAPPPRGAETFDLGELFEERLAAMTIQGPRELRFLPRGERGHRVRADRAAVAEAIASMLALAAGCAGAPTGGTTGGTTGGRSGGVVRAPYGPSEDGQVAVALEFAAGPLAGAGRQDLEGLLRPGGLGDRVEGLGAADLPAALAVARSQGGDLRLELEAPGRLAVRLLLPEVAPDGLGNGLAAFGEPG